MEWVVTILGILFGWCIFVSFIGWNSERDNTASSMYWLTLNMWAMFILSVIIWG